VQAVRTLVPGSADSRVAGQPEGRHPARFLAKVKYIDNPMLHWLLIGGGVIPVASDDPQAVSGAAAAGVTVPAAH